MNIRTFISYRNTHHSRNTAKYLAEALEKIEDPKIEVFLDQNKLKSHGGLSWAHTLYDNIHKSDVLIVLIEDGTDESSWVQREVDTARGAHVAILALVITDNSEAVSRVTHHLAIDHLQYLPLEYGDGIGQDILHSMMRLSKQTRQEQAKWIETIERERRLEPIVRQNPCYARYYHPDARVDCPIYLATGDATEFSGVDVLVNSENDFMQMARYLESHTLSATIRRKGAWVDEAGYVLRDTVQDMLDNQIDYSTGYRGRPVLPEQVIVTASGHPESELAQQGVRFIFHAATVTVDRDNQRVAPLSEKALGRAAFNCLRKVEELEACQGAIILNEDGTRRRLHEEADSPHRPIKHILFPIFGAGQGGYTLKDSMEAMLQGVRRFVVRANQQHELEHITLCIFDERDLPSAQEAFEASGFVVGD